MLFFLIFFGDLSFSQISTPPEDSLKYIALGDTLIASVSITESLAETNIKQILTAIPFFEKAKNQERLVEAYNKLTIVYYLDNKFDKADATNRKAIDIAAKGLPETNEHFINAKFNFITLSDKKGFKEEAIAGYHDIISIDKKINAPDDYLALDYHNLATAYLEIGDYEEAMEALANSLRIRENIKDAEPAAVRENEMNIGGVYADLAACFKKKKDYEEAITVFNKSINILSKFDEANEYVNQIRYNCYYGLADIYLQQGQKKLSYQYAYKAIDIKNKNTVFDDCYSYQILGKLYLSDGDSEKALAYFEKAIISATNEADGFANFPQIAIAYAQKGDAYLQLSAFDKALSVYQKGLQVIALDFDNQDVAQNPSLDQIIQKQGALDLINGKASACLAKYKFDGDGKNLHLANQHYQDGIKLIQAIRQGYNTEASKHLLAEKANLIYEKAIEVCYLLFQVTRDEKYLEQAFVFAENNKAITLLETINKEAALILSGIPDSLLGMERQLNIQLNFSEQLLAETKTLNQEKEMLKISQLEKERFDLKERYKSLIAKIEKEHPQYYRLKYINETATVKKIQDGLLDDKTALLEYFIGEKNCYSFLITKNDFKVEKVKKTAIFENQVNTLRQLLRIAPESETFASSFQSYVQNAHGFYKMMLQQQLSSLPAKVSNLVIIPDDIIGFVPFDILLTEAANPENANYSPRNLSYLMERFFVSYSYSGTLLLNEQKGGGKKNELGFIGFAPSFGDEKTIAERTCSDSELYSLRCSAEEINSINENFDGKVMEGTASTKTVFLEQVPNYNIVHLATHACINEDNAMLNRIHFSDDYITMYDLYNLRLNADLVVLSACNTGTGKMVKGEGVMSLSRGFIQSGASSILMSLWSVDDCATSTIMTSFYEELSRGYSKNAALQKAKLNYINAASDKIKAHPYFWSAFVVFGDTNPLVLQKRGFSWQAIVLLFVTFLSLIVFYYIKKARA